MDLADRRRLPVPIPTPRARAGPHRRRPPHLFYGERRDSPGADRRPARRPARPLHDFEAVVPRPAPSRRSRTPRGATRRSSRVPPWSATPIGRTQPLRPQRQPVIEECKPPRIRPGACTACSACTWNTPLPGTERTCSCRDCPRALQDEFPSASASTSTPSRGGCERRSTSLRAHTAAPAPVLLLPTGPTRRRPRRWPAGATCPSTAPPSRGPAGLLQPPGARWTPTSRPARERLPVGPGWLDACWRRSTPTRATAWPVRRRTSPGTSRRSSPARATPRRTSRAAARRRPRGSETALAPWSRSIAWRTSATPCGARWSRRSAGRRGLRPGPVLGDGLQRARGAGRLPRRLGVRGLRLPRAASPRAGAARRRAASRPASAATRTQFCGARLRGETSDYRAHCRGDACPNFAPGLVHSAGRGRARHRPLAPRARGPRPTAVEDLRSRVLGRRPSRWSAASCRPATAAPSCRRRCATSCARTTRTAS